MPRQTSRQSFGGAPSPALSTTRTPSSTPASEKVASDNSALLGLCLAGPTGSGKTALAMAFARALAHERGSPAVEVISVDSALVYRGMDIGTAKPSAAEQAEVPHHLIDLLDPREAYSAAAFVNDAQRIAAEIRARGRLPLLVGGTMLYLKALREGLDAMPAADAAVRAALDAEAAARGWPALHAELARVDPVTAQRLTPLDAQRIQRALEVWRVSGRPLSAWQRRSTQGGGDEGAASRDETGGAQAPSLALADWPLVSLEPVSRAWLHERLAQRFRQMLAQGFVDEVRRLHDRGDLHPGLPSMRCVGYRQAWAALESGRFEALEETGIAATRQLAKRQLTWLRSMPDRVVVACDDPVTSPADVSSKPGGDGRAGEATMAEGALARGMQALRQVLRQAGWRWPAP